MYFWLCHFPKNSVISSCQAADGQTPQKSFLRAVPHCIYPTTKTQPFQNQDYTLIYCKLVKIWLYFKSDPKLKFPPNVLLLGKWSISFAHNNFCVLQFPLFPNSILWEAIRGGKIKQLKELRGIPRRPLIPISFKRVLAPNLQNIWFSGARLGFFSFGEWSWSSDPHLHIKNDTDALERPQEPTKLQLFVLFFLLVQPGFIPQSLRIRFSLFSASCSFLVHPYLYLLHPEFPFTSPSKRPPR